MNNKPHYHKLVVNRLQELGEKFTNVYGKTLTAATVAYKLRGSSAGRAIYATNTIDLNPIILKDNMVPFIENTVAHEFAHLAAAEMHGKVKFIHGKEWQGIMASLGVKPNITHQYLIRRYAAVYSWACACMDHQVSKTTHVKMLGGKQYKCSSCQQPIQRFVDLPVVH